MFPLPQLKIQIMLILEHAISNERQYATINEMLVDIEHSIKHLYILQRCEVDLLVNYLFGEIGVDCNVVSNHGERYHVYISEKYEVSNERAE